MARCRSRGNASAVIRVGALVGCSARGAHRAARLRSSSVRSLRGAARGRARLARVAPRKGGGGSGASPASGPDELAHWLGAYLGRCPPPPARGQGCCAAAAGHQKCACGALVPGAASRKLRTSTGHAAQNQARNAQNSRKELRQGAKTAQKAQKQREGRGGVYEKLVNKL